MRAFAKHVARSVVFCDAAVAEQGNRRYRTAPSVRCCHLVSRLPFRVAPFVAITCKHDALDMELGHSDQVTRESSDPETQLTR